MALGLLYYGYFDSMGSSPFEGKVEIWKEGYAGASSEIVYNDLQACVIAFEGDKDHLEKVVFGSKLTYRFWCTPSDSDKYDALFEADHKEIVIKYYEDTVLKWLGYLDPAGLQREFLEAVYLIQLTANDGIADLKNEEFVDASGNQYTDRVSILTAMRRCLDKRGSDLALDFRIQLNTYESTLGSATSCALAENTIDCRRFTKTKDGITTNESCYHVLNEILQPFNVIFRQSDGYFWIRQKHELNSYVYAYTSAGTYQSRTASNLVQSIYNSKFHPKQNSLSKYRPHHKALVTFQNRNLGENIIVNPDFASGLTAWNNGTSPYNIYSLTAPSGVLKASEPDALGDSNVDKYFQTDTMSVTKYGDKDYLKFSLRAFLQAVSFNTGNYAANPLYLQLQVVYPDTSVKTTSNQPVQEGWATYTHPDYAFPITATGNYRLRILIHPHSSADYSAWEIWFDDFEGLTIYESADITFDKVTEVINSSPAAKAIVESTLYFGDSLQNNDLGAIKDGSDLTATWNLYGGSQQKPLVELYAMQLLADRQAWKNVLTLSIIDETNALKPHQVLQYNSREYDHYSWEKDCVQRTINVNLVEILTTAITYTASVQTKTSIDGESSGGSTQISSGGGVSDHGALSGLSDNDHPQYFRKNVDDNNSTYKATFGKVGIGNFTLEISGTDFLIKNSTTTILKLTSGGILNTRDNIEANDTSL